jgi:paraquat-inducible protein B
MYYTIAQLVLSDEETLIAEIPKESSTITFANDWQGEDPTIGISNLFDSFSTMRVGLELFYDLNEENSPEIGFKVVSNHSIEVDNGSNFVLNLAIRAEAGGEITAATMPGDSGDIKVLQTLPCVDAAIAPQSKATINILVERKLSFPLDDASAGLKELSTELKTLEDIFGVDNSESHLPSFEDLQDQIQEQLDQFQRESETFAEKTTAQINDVATQAGKAANDALSKIKGLFGLK